MCIHIIFFDDHIKIHLEALDRYFCDFSKAFYV